jgi:cation diffusion facilitator CzcD-associated flavoprotein CzcO
MGADRRAKAIERRRTAQRNGVTRGDTYQDGHTETYTASVLWMRQVYYRHVERSIPDWPGMSDLSADLVHPQRWPHGYDRSGTQVFVIGSGTTAVTIIPAHADTVALWCHSQDCWADKANRCRQRVSSAGTGHRKVDHDNGSIHCSARL